MSRFNFKPFFKKLGRRKSLEILQAKLKNSTLNRTLGVVDLISVGIGCTIGSGIFVLTGDVAKNIAGPSVIISFIISGISASLTAFSYAELSAIIPSAGAGYSFIYVALGEFLAWIGCCCAFLQYLVGSATIASGWASYFNHLLQNIFKVQLPYSISNPVVKVNPESGSLFFDSAAVINLPAVIVVFLMTMIMIKGIRESTLANNIIVIVKVASILFFIFSGIAYIQRKNYSPFIPEKNNSRFGAVGVFIGAQRLYMAYVGFDSVASTSQEAKNPKKDIPIGIIVSLFISTVLYVSVAAVLVGVQDYRNIDSTAISKIFSSFKNTLWIEIVINIGALSGLTSAVLVNLMVQSRVLMTVAEDKMLPSVFSRLHRKFKTPYWATIVSGSICILLSALLPTSILADLVSCGSLIVYSLVNISVIVLGRSRPDIERPYKVPFGPYIIPGLGALISLALLFMSENGTKIRVLVLLLLVSVFYFIYPMRKSDVENEKMEDTENNAKE
ncbi:hypothetical protein BB560_006611 [Smittium megazygosporum]|uniref:Cationic amino acid transporter C-terminal domain-containing protein n=1 Tax=Smittium megazygosporum TaxID=133381 RepID=A0A2T9Y329_9FUNG|nr:hypothetical protein BB560_006611 [Smittium megazygosporum]